MKDMLRTLLVPSGILVLAVTAAGCKEEIPPPPPLPPAESAQAPATLELKPVDAAMPEEEEEKPTGKGGAKSGGLAPCCAALAQNSTMAPEPTKTYMVQAAALCQAAAAQGQDKAVAMGMILGALKGAGIPTACK
jgi:hypothetical protein